MFTLRCWLCREQYRSRYERRKTGLCQRCYRGQRTQYKRGLTPSERESIEAERIHSTLYGPECGLRSTLDPMAVFVIST